ncbi:MAG: pentapeptide repeat-containing protein [Planctomycetota bacterium]
MRNEVPRSEPAARRSHSGERTIRPPVAPEGAGRPRRDNAPQGGRAVSGTAHAFPSTGCERVGGADVDALGCDFAGCDFAGCDFAGCDFAGCDFELVGSTVPAGELEASASVGPASPSSQRASSATRRRSASTPPSASTCSGVHGSPTRTVILVGRGNQALRG